MTRSEIPKKNALKVGSVVTSSLGNKQKLFDPAIIGDPEAAMEFITNILESSTEYSIIAKDLSGTILLWNEGARRLYGYEPEEMIGKVNASILYTEEDVEAGLPQKIFDEVHAHGKFEGTVSRKRKNGDRFTSRLVITLRCNAEGKPLGFLLISKDISDEIRMSQYARILIEASLDPLVTINADGKITDVNETTTKVTGVPRGKLIGTDFSSYFTEPKKAQEAYRQGFAKGMVTNYPLTICHVDGRLTDVIYNASVYRDERGNVLGVFAAARDVTAQKQAEAQVADQRAKELEKLAELERFQKLTIGRELKMIELKKEIEDLKRQVS
ncbi:MAG: PAS domain-containing protein [Pseudomonadota bacterium]